MREHGTYARYVLGPDIRDEDGRGCRCDHCRQGNSAYERERKQRKAPAYVGANEARRHLAWLAEQGIGSKTVAKVSGVSHGALSKLVYGNNHGRGPSKRIRPETRDAILAVLPHEVVNGSRVDAGSTLAIVDELVGRGWSKSAIAKHVHGPHAVALQLGDEFVTRVHAAAVKTLLDLPVERRLSRWGTPVALAETADPVEYLPSLPLSDGALRRRQVRARKRARDLGEDPDEVVIEQPDPYDLPRLVLDADMTWTALGACRYDDVPNWLFFPSRGDHVTLTMAKEVCARCPVVEECLAFALDHQPDGVWGGTSKKERRELRRKVAV